MMSQTDKADAFHLLHQQDAPFIIPNPWDIGSARMLAAKGFSALATTSAGFAFSTGRRDGALSRNDVMEHCRAIVDACDLPVSADLEDGYGADAAGVQDTIKAAAETGLVGGSIEDAKMGGGPAIYELSEAVDRVRAAVEAAAALPFKFTLTARSENYLHGRPDLDDTLRRLQAFQEAGADVLYAPGLTSLDDIATLTSSVDLPVNVVAGLPGARFSVAQLAAVGVTRISLGSALFRAAFGVAVAAADEMNASGTFDFAADAMGFSDIADLVARD